MDWCCRAADLGEDGEMGRVVTVGVSKQLNKALRRRIRRVKNYGVRIVKNFQVRKSMFIKNHMSTNITSTHERIKTFVNVRHSQ